MNAGLMKLHGYSAEDVSAEAARKRHEYAEELLRAGMTEDGVQDGVVRKFGIGISKNTICKLRAKVKSESFTYEDRVSLVGRLLASGTPQRRIIEIVKRDTGGTIGHGTVCNIRRRLGLSKQQTVKEVASVAKAEPVPVSKSAAAVEQLPVASINDGASWRYVVEAVKKTHTRHGMSLEYARCHSFENGVFYVSFPAEAGFHRASVFGSGWSAIEGIMSTAMGRDIQLREPGKSQEKTEHRADSDLLMEVERLFDGVSDERAKRIVRAYFVLGGES